MKIIKNGILTSLLLSLIFGFVFMSNFASADITSNQVGFWKFEEGTGTTTSDSSGNGNTGTLVNSPTWVTTGAVGKALSFDGVNDRVTAGTSSTLNVSTNTLTLAGWVKRGTTSATGAIMTRGLDGGSGYSLALGGSGCTTDQVRLSKYAIQHICLDSFPADTQWHHIAVVAGGSGVTLYLDGSAIDTDPDTQNFVPVASRTFFIGSYNASSMFLNAQLDELRVFKRALSASDVGELFSTDTIAPTVSIISPTSGATVSGNTIIDADASDNVGVAGVQFKLDGANLGSEDTTLPYSIIWDTTTTTNGSHTLTAVARDAANNSTTSSGVPVTVNNTSPPPGGDWPNQPSDYTTITDWNFDSLSGSGWDVNPSPNVTVVTDSTAPFSPSNVGQWKYPIGFPGGEAPSTMYYGLPASYTEGYVGFWWKPSSPWEGHSSGVNKIAFIFGNPGHIIPVMYGSPGGPYELRIAPEWGSWSWLTPNENNVSVSLGEWHRIEIYFNQQTTNGTIKWWMDGELIGNYTNVSFASGQEFQEFQFSPTWGGVGGSKTQLNYFWYDHVIISKP